MTLDPFLKDKVGTFDTILSFETIEHVEDDQLFVESLYHLLNPGGRLIVSTPFGQGRGKPCGSPYHYHQLTEDEFSSLFDQFHEKEIFFQRHVTIEPKRPDLYYPLGVAVCKKR